MLRAGKQTIVDFIVSCLEKGEERGKIMVKAGKKWGTKKSAFDRMLRIAKQQHADKQDAIKKELAEIDKQAAIEARRKAIMTAFERKERLSKIAKGEITVPYSEVKWNPKTQLFETIQFVELASHTAMISAMAEISKMEGDYAPTKLASTDSKGDDLPQIDYSKMSIEELKILIALHDKYAAKP